MQFSFLTIYSKLSSLSKIPETDIIRYLIIGALFINIFYLSSCSSEKENPVAHKDDECPAEQWDFDTSGGNAYIHDCNPYESDHFTVYSDGSSLESKRQLAEIAEEVFDELVTEFLITSIEDELLNCNSQRITHIIFMLRSILTRSRLWDSATDSLLEQSIVSLFLTTIEFTGIAAS
jgi:hypothetical protein